MSRIHSVTVFASVAAVAVASLASAAHAGVLISTRAVPVLTVDGEGFRDLDRNGVLDPYEDWRLTADQRTEDLLSRMTLEEKAGAMLHATLPSTAPAPFGRYGLPSPSYDFEAAADLIVKRNITSLLTRQSLQPRLFAEQNNEAQALAERGRLGIPLLISTDPRSHFQYVVGATSAPDSFSQWPDALGFGALGDADVVRTFADAARQEYRAVGIHAGMPQADLATEPLWPRQTGTFGSNAVTVSAMIQAYVEGFQHGADGLAPDGVLAIVKHWVGYGAEPGGFDGHNYYGRVSRLDNAAFAEHVAAFQGAFAAQAGAVMPSYTITEGVTIDGQALDPVGSGFNRKITHDLLRETHGFQGLVISDWDITNDCNDECRTPTRQQTTREIGMPWGLEDKTIAERFEAGLAAGIDQFGGTDEPEYLIAAVREGHFPEQRLDESVRRVLLVKFRLGLFDNPFVDPIEAEQVAGNARFVAEADVVQRRAQVLLENHDLLPLRPGLKVFVHGLAAEAVRAAGFTVVHRLEDADVALIRMSTPHETLHPFYVFGGRQNEGRIDFRDGDEDYDALKLAAASVPVVASVYMDRPAILTNVRDKTVALLVNFGASDAALLDVMTGQAVAEGRLPFELPSSMGAVEAQDSATPNDSDDPLYPVGAGILHDP